MHSPGSMGGGSGTQLGGAMGGDTGSWWSLDDGPDSCRPRPAALKDLRIISLRRRLVTIPPKDKRVNNLDPVSVVLPKWTAKTFLCCRAFFVIHSVELIYPLLLEEPVLFPELLLETTEMALAIASTADRRSANVFLSDLSASEMK